MKNLFLLFLLLVSLVSLANEEVDVYLDFWTEYEKMAASRQKLGESAFEKSWLDIRAKAEAQTAGLSRDELTALKSAQNIYEESLASATNPDVRLESMKELVDVYLKLDTATADTEYLFKGIALIEEILRSHRQKVKADLFAYKLAMAYEKAKRHEDSQRVWEQLANSELPSKQSFYAALIMGDESFRLENPAMALSYYKKAFKFLSIISYEGKIVDDVSLAYRLMWSLYRTGAYDEILTHGFKILETSHYQIDAEKMAGLKKDAVALMANALCDNRNPGSVNAVMHKEFSPMVRSLLAIPVMTRFVESKAFDEALDLGHLIIKEDPLNENIPSVTELLVKAYRQKGASGLEMNAIYNIVKLMDTNSLWAQKNRAHGEKISLAQHIGLALGPLAARFYYETGKEGKIETNLRRAKYIFSMLAGTFPEDPDAGVWQVILGEVYDLLGEEKKTIEIYKKMERKSGLSEKEKHAYERNLVMAQFDLWRKVDERLFEERKRELDKLEGIITQYAATFPHDASGFLFELAEAFISLKEPRRAEVIYQKILVDEKNSDDRRRAIRGSITVIHTDFRAISDLVQDFLSFEKPEVLTHAFRAELLGVLSTSLFRLRKKSEDAKETLGEVGRYLVQSAERVTSLPHRARHWKDGTFLLALSKDWAQVKRSVLSYRDAFGKGHSPAEEDEMLYLLARSYEFLFAFDEAAEIYHAFSAKYPEHQYARIGLERAIKLRAFTKNYRERARAGLLLARRLKERTEKLEVYYQVFDDYVKADMKQDALTLKDKLLSLSLSDFERLNSLYLLASAEGETKEAMKLWGKIDGLSKSAAPKLGDTFTKLRRSKAQLEMADISQKQSVEKIDLFASTTLDKDFSLLKSSFANVASFYAEAQKIGNLDRAAEARWFLADMSEKVGRETLSVLALRKSTISGALENEMNVWGQTLIRQSKALHAENMLSQTQHPDALSANKWIKRSQAAVELSKDAGSEEDFAPLPIYWPDFMPFWPERVFNGE